jgi:lipopolysaccharide transport system ATP-binding protein
MKPAIRVENLSKRYRVVTGPNGGTNATEMLTRAVKDTWRKVKTLADPGAMEEENTFWALKDVSFEVQPGEVVGVIGRNGAGKSTLLKILSRIVEPTGGRAEIRGRMGSLLEVGTGFHAELTGRENVYLNGAVLGMSRREIAKKFDEIVAFSGVEKFLDTPVKRYSSGMYVRLAFAVAAHLEPEILVVDEVLAVGDAEFQKKCIEKMRSVGRSGHTVVLVSHNLTQIESLCKRVLTLHKGHGQGFGPTAEQVCNYLGQQRQETGPLVELENHPHRVNGTTPIMTDLTVLADGVPSALARMSGSFGFEVSYKFVRKPRDLRIGFVLENPYGVKVTAISPTFEDPHLLDNPPAEGRIRAIVSSHNLVADTYTVNVYMHAEGMTDGVAPAGYLVVEADDVFATSRSLESTIAPTYQRCQWEISW